MSLTASVEELEDELFENAESALAYNRLDMDRGEIALLLPLATMPVGPSVIVEGESVVEGDLVVIEGDSVVIEGYSVVIEGDSVVIEGG